MKRALAVIMAFTLIFVCLTVNVSATTVDQNGSSASTSLEFSLHGQYAIIIPSELELSENGDGMLQIRADHIHLIEGESAVVKIAESSFGESDYFELKHTDNEEAYIECFMSASTLSDTMYREINKKNASTEPVITFTAADRGDIGYLHISAIVQPSSFAGNYTGTLMFDISLEVETTAEE